MKKLSQLMLLGLYLQAMFSCQNPNDKETTQSPQEAKVSVSENFVGDYVTESYDSRSQGSDWIVARISKPNDDLLKLEISSRADRKRPSCTWSTSVQIKDENTLFTYAMEEEILIKLDNNILTITATNPEEDGVLSFFCGGGASLSGYTYKKLSEPLDETQLKAFSIEKSNSLQGINFEIKATEQNPNSEVIITPSGLEETNGLIQFETVGTLMESEVEDLNSDGSPELILFFTRFGESVENYLKIFSGNNNKSISEVAIPSFPEEFTTGFQGLEEWAIVETSIIARFPIFEEENGEWVRSGLTRQIQYKLVERENGRKLELDRVFEIEDSVFGH